MKTKLSRSLGIIRWKCKMWKFANKDIFWYLSHNERDAEHSPLPALHLNLRVLAVNSKLKVKLNITVWPPRAPGLTSLHKDLIYCRSSRTTFHQPSSSQWFMSSFCRKVKCSVNHCPVSWWRMERCVEEVVFNMPATIIKTLDSI